MPERESDFVLPIGRVKAGWWGPLGIALAAADYLTGYVAVPPMFAVPVTIAAWFSGAMPAVSLAIGLPLVRLLLIEHVGSEVTVARFSAGVLTLMLLAFVAARLGEHEHDLRRRIAALESLLPICAWCKGIRTDDGTWRSLESYMQSSGKEVTHGICPDCAREHFPG